MAAPDANYEPPAAMARDPGNDYSGFEQIWSQQNNQIQNMVGDDGDIRFYYSGMAQAVIPDRLAPGR